MKFAGHIICVLLLSIFPLWTIGQQKITFSHLGAADGLPDTWVNGIVQDSLGFIYIITQSGFNRFDGTQFQVFTDRNNIIGRGAYHDLLVDQKGRIWCSHFSNSVFRYNDSKNNLIPYKVVHFDADEIKRRVIEVLYEDRQGTIWVGTEGGLSFYDEAAEKFRDFFEGDSGKAGISAVFSLFERSDGSFWAGTAEGKLYKIDRKAKSCTPYSFNFEQEDKKGLTSRIWDLEEWEHGLYLATEGNGLIKLDLRDGTMTNFFKGQAITCLFRDRSGVLWLGSNKNGLVLIKEDDVENPTYEAFSADMMSSGAMESNKITDIFEDREGNIWIARQGEGGIDIAQVEKETRELLPPTAEGGAFAVSSLYNDDNILWMGKAPGGLARYNLDTGTLEEYGANTKIRGSVESIAGQLDGDLWVGTATELLRFNPSEGITKRYESIPGNDNASPFMDVRFLLVTPSQEVWVASKGGGLSQYSPKDGTFTNYTYQEGKTDGLSNNKVMCLYRENDSILWMGTHGGGLNRMNTRTKKFEWMYSDSDNEFDLWSNYIYSIIKDRKENLLWLATGKGIGKLDLKTRQLETVATNNTVLGVLQDDQSRIWAMTANGLFVYDPADPSVKPMLHSKGQFYCHSLKDSKGLLYFSGKDGVTVVDPNKKLVERELPEVTFTDLQFFTESVPISEGGVLDKGIWLKEQIEIPYSKSVFSLSYSLLEYPVDNDLTYDIKMEGFENNWRNIGRRSEVTYTNLSPGTYEFKVRPEIKKLNLSGPVKNLKVVVLPPFWRTWWAYLAYGLIVALILWSYRNYTLKWARIKSELHTEVALREQEDELHRAKERFFTDISHEIRTPVTLITGSLNSLSQANFNAPQLQKMGMLKGSANRLLNLVNELLNVKKLETGTFVLQVSQNDLVAFAHEIFLAFSQQAINNDIRYVFEKKGDQLKIWFDKVQLEKTLFNLISNAFKFTRPGDEITVSVYSEGGNAYIDVADTGIGIPPDKQSRIFERFFQDKDSTNGAGGFGIGLSVAKQVVEHHGGTISLESEDGQGSRFTVRLPMGRSHFTDAQIVTDPKKTEAPANASKAGKENERGYLQFSGSSILVVEDDRHLREYLCELLSEHFKVDSAANGKIALEMALESMPDCIVSDVMMPEMDGISLCHALKTGVMTSHIPVILLTARTMVEHIMEGYETGADDYLVKPFDEEMLRVRVGNLLANRERLRKRFAQQALIDPREIALTSPDEKFLTALNEIVEGNISDPELNTEFLASEMAMSHSSLYKKLKALTGMTIVGFVRDFRLKRAAQMFAQQKLSVAEVRSDLGYSDRKHFSREFKKKFGMPPSEYAKKNLETESQENKG